MHLCIIKHVGTYTYTDIWIHCNWQLEAELAVVVKEALYEFQKSPTRMWKGSYIYVKRGLHVCQKSPISICTAEFEAHSTPAAESLSTTPNTYAKRALHACQKSPLCVSKEPYMHICTAEFEADAAIEGIVERALYVCQKSPTRMSKELYVCMYRRVWDE